VKPGDVVELKDGTLGLSGSDLYAIYLDRVKVSGNYHVQVHTVHGIKQVGRDRVHRTVLKARVDDPVEMDDAERDARLEQLVREIETEDEDTEVERRHDLDELDDRRLWELIVNDADGSFTPEDAARLLVGKPDEEDVADVREALSSCQAEGVGYFERAEGRGERYAAYDVDEIKAVRREIEGLRAVRNNLIQVEEVEPEDEDLEPYTEIHALHPDEAGLDDEDERRLDLIADQMRDFVLHDRDRGQVGLADTPIHTLDGFVLQRFCRFFAFDWVGEDAGSISGAFVRFLVETDLHDVREANDLVAKRHVNLAEHATWEYPDRALKAAQRLPDGIPDAWREHRRDLTHLETYTIDPPSAEDFDDAVSLERDGDDRLLYVHIADVAQYVEPRSTVDWEARSRGTSVYLPTDVLPMLPPRLAEDLCSLRAGAPRPAFTARLRVDPDGHVTEHEVFESVVEVDGNRSYDEANRAIDAGEPPERDLHALAQDMRSHRESLELATGELRVEIAREGVDPTRKTASPSTRLIEQFMVAANEAVGETLTEADVPVPYRCHPLPERGGVEEFNKQMRALELDLGLQLPEFDDEEADEDEGQELMDALEGGKVELVEGGFISDEEDGDEPGDEEPEEAGPAAHLDGLADYDEDQREAWLAPFHEALDQVHALEDDALEHLVHLKLLGCLGRALYTPANIGHFGLASTCYLHFTSPIRRYPDLVTHRQLKWHLRRDREADDAYTGEDPPHDAEELETLCPKNTDQSVEAEQLERDLIAVAMAFDALEDHWEGRQTGLVNGITKGGVFLSLPRGLEARLATSDIPGGPWEVDEAGAKLFKGERDPGGPDEELLDEILEVGWREVYDEDLGEAVQVRLRLGDRVPVRLSGVDLASGQVSVRLAGTQDDEDDEDDEDDAEDAADEATGEDEPAPDADDEA